MGYHSMKALRHLSLIRPASFLELKQGLKLMLEGKNIPFLGE